MASGDVKLNAALADGSQTQKSLHFIDPMYPYELLNMLFVYYVSISED